MARPLGSLDKNKKFLLVRLKDMYGEQFEPIMRAAALAVRLDDQIKEADAALVSIENPLDKIKIAGANTALVCDAIDKWCKIAEFTNGKVSAITLSQDPDNPLFEMKTDERFAEYRRMVEAARFRTSQDASASTSGNNTH